MKILRLRLLAYGPFTNETLDFSARQAGFRLVYGPNEAGKSSALRALRAAFFEIEERTSDNFVHENAKLRIGLDLADETGSELNVVRRKGRKATLRDGQDDGEVSAAVLERMLGGLRPREFDAMFGIRQSDLAKGAEDLRAGKGELSEVLFAAGGGLGDLHEVHQRLAAEAEELFLPKGSKPALNAALAKYKEAKIACRNSTLSASEWTRKTKELDKLDQQVEEFQTKLHSLELKKGRLQRLCDAHADAAELEQARERMQSLAGVRPLGENFGDRRHEAATQWQLASQQERDARNQLEFAQRQLDKLEATDDPDELKSLHAALLQQQGVYQGARRDLPAMQADCDSLFAKARAALEGLLPGSTLEDADRVRVAAPRAGAIRKLAKKHQTFDVQKGEQERELAAADELLAAAERELADLAAPPDVERLAAAFADARAKGDLESALDSAAAEEARLAREVAGALGRLRGWTSDLAGLEAYPAPPPEAIDRFERQLNGLNEQIREIKRRREQTQEAETRLHTDLRELQLAGDVPTESDLQAARADRDVLWRQLRERAARREEITPADGQSFERATSRADELADRLRREADRVARQASLQAAWEAARRDLESLAQQAAAVERATAATLEDWRSSWPGLDLHGAAPREMVAWLAARDAVLQSGKLLRAQQEQLRLTTERAADLRRSLAAELTAVLGAEPAGANSLAALRDRAEQALQSAASLAEARQTREQDARQARHRAERAREKLARIGRELADWRKEWAPALAGAALPANTPADQADELLSGLSAMHTDRDEAAKLARRIDDMERSIDEFHAQIAATAEKLALPIAELQPEAAAARVLAEVQRRLEIAGRRAPLEEQRVLAQRAVQGAHENMQLAQATLGALVREAGCENEGELPRAEELSRQARDAKRRVGELEASLTRRAGGEGMAAFAAEALAQPIDALPGDIEDLDRERQQLFHEYGALREQRSTLANELKQLEAKTPAAEAAEELNGLRAGLVAGAEEYARLRLAAAVLRQAMERYRKKNEGPVLGRASELFSRLTLGDFSGARADLDDEGQPVLAAVRAGGEHVPIAGLSDGTRDQLFLALRLASLEHYLDGHDPAPLIVDDACIQFDDARAKAALAALGELSERTQVIFFTHHEHLVELAQQALPPERLAIHRLPRRGEARSAVLLDGQP